MKILKNKNITWWIGVGSCIMLFTIIGVFSYMKMDFVIHGVQISASIKKDGTSPLVEVIGKAPNATYISLNGREIYIDTDGSFDEKVALIPGLSVMTLNAEDKFGNQREKKLEVMYNGGVGAVAIGNTIINTN